MGPEYLPVLPGIRVILIIIICFCAVKNKDMGVHASPACHNCADDTP